MAALLPGPEAFQVFEIPLYEPCGQGEHLYVAIEKTGLTTDAVAAHLARACAVKPTAVGWAGRKDRHAVTRQWFSIHHGCEEGLARLQISGLTVLAVSRHRNKLKPGHLCGNRFRLLLHQIDDHAGLERAATRLWHGGLINRYGDQRFGLHHANVGIARCLAGHDLAGAVRLAIDPTGDWRSGVAPPEHLHASGPQGRMIRTLQRRPGDWQAAWRAADKSFHRLIVNAGQSAVFNAVLAGRRATGLLYHPVQGDIVRRHGGGCFACPSAALDELRPRCRPPQPEVLLTGPIPGRHRMRPSMVAAALEADWSRAAGFDPAWFGADGPLSAPGDRRCLISPLLSAPSLTRTGPGTATLELSLERGSYATVALEELSVTIPAKRRGEDA